MKDVNLSRKIRLAARTILADSRGRLALADLKKKVERHLKTSLRSDFFRGALCSRGSGLEVYQNVVLLTIMSRKGDEQVPRAKSRTTRKRTGGRVKKLTVEEFTLLAIKRLRKPGYKGIHAVFSGFNTAFREYFPGKDPVKEVNKLVEQGKVSVRPAKGGAIIYAGKVEQPNTADVTLGKMGL